MPRLGFCFFCLFLAWALVLPHPVAADLKPVVEETEPDFKALFERYWELRQGQAVGGEDPGRPGFIAGGWTSPPRELFREKWPFRATTYELFFPDSKSIARVVYGLALFARDLDPSVSLERFERGAGGFHYRVDQVAHWAEAVRTGEWKTYTREEREFLERLLRDRVIMEKDGRIVVGNRVTHVLGAAPQKKRTLHLNLTHERTHVLWDEDRTFQKRHIDEWRNLTEEDRKAVYTRLKGYDPSNEMQIIEEWSVRKNEKKPFWQ